MKIEKLNELKRNRRSYSNSNLISTINKIKKKQKVKMRSAKKNKEVSEKLKYEFVKVKRNKFMGHWRA